MSVAVPGHRGRERRGGICIHRPRNLATVDRTRQRGIPVTTPARTIADLRRLVGPAELRRAIRQAEALGLPLGANAGNDRTRSELEHLFLALCNRHRIPEPELRLLGYEVIRFSHRQVTRDPAAIIAALRGVLADPKTD